MSRPAARRTVAWWLAVAGEVRVRRAGSAVPAGLAAAYRVRARVAPSSVARAPSGSAGAAADQTAR
ncbi:hypothetical protein ACIA98_23335 [Streptomyces sp. NPDC051366]|uniref:hypothetical protein n=1 Tax=Streptomyces sp. NPDC051366 TaxID=3365652 RepID=UPI003787FCE8